MPAHMAMAMDCSGLPTSFTGNEFPTGDFFGNFDNSCYKIRLGAGNGSLEYGDLNAVYYQMFFKVDPRYELILMGDFPNTRYFSISLNDAHSALSQSILDKNIVPLTAEYINPYLPGVSYVAGQEYAVPISFGGTPGKMETGCKMTGYNVSVNGLDATQRHPGMDWNSDAALFQQKPSYVYHVVDTPQHTNPNTAGLIMVRAYMDESTADGSTHPSLIVRDVASGCAYPAAYALSSLQVVTVTNTEGLPWLDKQQDAGHKNYEASYLPKLCDASRPSSDSLRWWRQPEFVPISNPDAAYIVANVPPGLPATLATAQEAMRIRVRIPNTPQTPCTNGCSRSGDEQMRYMSLTFSEPSGTAMVSLADTAFTKDPNGYATLIVGTGATIPAWITPANGYTFLDLTTKQGYQQFSLLTMRHIIPGTGFNCAGQFVPYRTGVDTPAGSLLGDYTPVVDYPAAASLPETASPLVGPSACGMYPAGEPGDLPKCGVFPAPGPAITGVITQCSTPGCNQFAAQNNPPITVVGDGFGAFPEGLPFTGTSQYLGIRDVTHGWRAGLTGGTCNISISSWETGTIQFVANVPDENGKCKLKSGDEIKVEVTNPQTGVTTSFKTTAE